jgi:uncharacterized protein with GYD domain
MNNYVLLSRLTPDGARSMWSQPRRIQEVNEEVEEFGCRVISQFATLGPYDFVTTIEAPDDASVLKLSAMLGSRGTVQILSMPAVWVGDFLDSLRPEGDDEADEVGVG